jgi:hypothetical protein
MCTPDQDHLADWLAGRLDPAAAARTAAHVAVCPACRAESDALARLAAAIRTASAMRAEGVEVPAYRLPPPSIGRPAILPHLGRTVRRTVPTALRLRAAAGLMAAVGVAIGAVAWRAAGPIPGTDRGADQRAGTDAVDVVALAPTGPTIVARQPTAVVRPMRAAPARSVPGPIAAAPRPVLGAVAVVPATAASSAAPAPAVPATPVDRERPDAPYPPSATDAATPQPLVPTAAPGTDQPAPPTSPTPPTNPASPTSPTSPSTPAPIATPTAVVPTIAGLVIGADGGPLAGARVVVEPYDGGAVRRAVTGPDGRYGVDVAPGRWLVRAEADGYVLTWHGGAPAPAAAQAIDVTDGGTHPPVDFALEPLPGPFIRGRVVDAAGNGVPGALVVAARPGDRAVDVGAAAAAVYADEAGAYALPITPGGWLVAATTDWRRGAMAWWGGDGSILQADRVPVDVEATAEDIDLHLPQ